MRIDKNVNLKRNNPYYWYPNGSTKFISTLLLVISLGIHLTSQSVIANSHHRNNYEG